MTGYKPKGWLGFQYCAVIRWLTVMQRYTRVQHCSCFSVKSSPWALHTIWLLMLHLRLHGFLSIDTRKNTVNSFRCKPSIQLKIPLVQVYVIEELWIIIKDSICTHHCHKCEVSLFTMVCFFRPKPTGPDYSTCYLLPNPA